MKTFYPSKKIYLSKSKIKNAGRGVFASKDIKKNEVIEICPVIEVPMDDLSNLKESILVKYYFSFEDNKDLLVIALGFGALYNHSYKPNATYKKISKDKVIEFGAIKDINKDEEITVNYNSGDPDDKSQLWKDIPPFKEQTTE
ncbi:MAG TPA: SET domain-containing protein [Candidatus Nanoarchaeia archaeon]